MRTTILALVLSFAAAGCTSAIDKLILTPTEAQKVADNVEIAVDAQQKLSEYVLEATRGDVDLEAGDVEYIAPVPENGFVGTLTIMNGVFSFGTGDLRIDFTAADASGPVDPYAVDVRTAALVIDALVTFNGFSNVGGPLTGDADVKITTLENTAEAATALVQGTFDVDHNGYGVDFSTNDLELGFDLTLDKVTSVAGKVSGNVDIPDFFADANFDVEGLGDKLEIAVDVAVTTLRYTLDLIDLG